MTDFHLIISQMTVLTSTLEFCQFDTINLPAFIKDIDFSTEKEYSLSLTYMQRNAYPCFMMFLHFPAACRGNPTSYFKFNSYKLDATSSFFSAAEWFLGMLREKSVYLPVLRNSASSAE